MKHDHERLIQENQQISPIMPMRLKLVQESKKMA